MKRTILTYAHPIVFGIVPIISLWPSDRMVMLRQLAVLIIATVVLIRLLRPVIPMPGRRALFLSLLYLLLFNYPKICFSLKAFPTISSLLNQLWFVVVCFGGICAVLIWLFRRPGSPFLVVGTCANICALAFLGSTLIQVAALTRDQSLTGWREPVRRIVDRGISQEITEPQVRPDIYYIILDGYARADVLKKVYGLDNSEFLANLSNLGFYVPERAHSNYSQTYLSLASSLNLEYLDELHASMPAGTANRQPLAYLLERNVVAQNLRRSGYKFVFLGSDYEATRSNPQADVCYCSILRPSTADDNLIAKTPLWLWLGQDAQVAEHRNRNLNNMNVLGSLPPEKDPIFVFAHIIAPHPPFVFDANGGAVINKGPFSLNDGSNYYGTSEEYAAGYRQQLIYINTRTLEFVQAILRRSSVPPIIILQADHGPGARWNMESAANTDLEERLGIFAAYYVPESIRQELTEDFTPVNTFRLIFDKLIGTHYGLLPNRSYFSKWTQPYDFELVRGAEAHVSR